MVIAMVCLSISVSAYDFKVDGIAYNITSASDLTCEVVPADMDYVGDLDIPTTVSYKGKKLMVTSVRYECFKNNKNYYCPLNFRGQHKN